MDAQSKLASTYQTGYVGVFEPDYAKAAKWYKKAAEQGDALSQVNLGEMYLKGEGVLKSWKRGVRWLRKAADQRYALGELKLAETLDSTNPEEALSWYRKAAAQGRRGAYNALAEKYYSGEGAPKDLVQAHMWYNLLFLGNGQWGVKGKEMREKIAKELTPEQLEKAEDMAIDWMEQHEQ